MGRNAAGYHSLYDSAAWRGRLINGRRVGGLKLSTLVNDSYQCRTCRTLCGGLPGADTAPIADHITPHHGDPDLFYDPENLQCLCLRCHNRKTAGEERRGYISEVGEDGFPTDPRHPFNAHR